MFHVNWTVQKCESRKFDEMRISQIDDIYFKESISLR